MPLRQIVFVRQLRVSHTVNKTIFQDLPVPRIMDILVNRLAYLAVSVLLHFFTLPVPLQVGQVFVLAEFFLTLRLTVFVIVCFAIYYISVVSNIIVIAVFVFLRYVCRFFYCLKLRFIHYPRGICEKKHCNQNNA